MTKEIEYDIKNLKVLPYIKVDFISILIFFSLKIEFNPSILNIEKELIGEINCHLKLQRIKKSIQKGDFETISIDENPYQMCRLLNRCFVSSNGKSATLYNENFRLLKTIYIPGSAYGCAVHKDKGIYISDYTECCIYLMDNQLNMIKTFGTRGSDTDQFDSPSSIFCQDEYLFVSDQENKRIQILTLDLKYHDTIQLDFKARFIAVSSSTICLCCKNNGIYFYETKTKELKKKYPNFKGRISVIDSNFYVVSCLTPKILYVFDKEGELIDETRVKTRNDSINDIFGWDGFMISMEDYFLIISNFYSILKFKYI